MGIIGFLLLALALGADCFSVSVTCGMIEKRMGRQVVTMALAFGLFQALMPLIGWLAVNVFAHRFEAYDHWIAFGLLLFIGGRMIIDNLRPQANVHHIDPRSLRVILTLAVATSIDALAVGFSFVGMGIRSMSDAILPLVVIGLTSAVLSFLGKYVGIKIGRHFHFPAEFIGGMILIAIGCKILFEHLCR